MLAEAIAATNDYLQAPSPLADQIGAAAMSAYVLQKLKNSNISWLSWINEHSTVVNRAISILFAILSTSGIHAFWHASGATVAAGGTFSVVLAEGWIGELKSAVWKTSQSFIMQQMVYQGLLKHEPGQSAVDTVAREVEENKERLAAKVIKAQKDTEE